MRRQQQHRIDDLRDTFDTTEGETTMRDTNETRGVITPESIGQNLGFAAKENTTSTTVMPENGHGVGDEFGGEDAPLKDFASASSAREPSVESEEEGEATDDEPTDDEVADGTVLEPGYHLFEVATAIPCKQDVLLAGVTRLGIANVRLDQSRTRSAAQLALREHRFLANVTKRLELHQPNGGSGRDGAVRWLFAEPLDTEPRVLAGDVRNFRLKLEAYDLEPHMLYEALFFSRERSQPTRQTVEEYLNEMGFMIQSLTCIQRDLRLPDRPGVSIALWFGILEWDSTESVVTEDDPFYFESLIART